LEAAHVEKVFQFGAPSLTSEFKFDFSLEAPAAVAAPTVAAIVQAPSAPASKSPKGGRSAKDLKQKRAASAMEQHKARMAKRAEKKEGTGKLGALQQKRAEVNKRAPKRKVKDWDAIYARQMAKQESLSEHLARKTALKSASVKPSPSVQRSASKSAAPSVTKSPAAAAPRCQVSGIRRPMVTQEKKEVPVKKTIVKTTPVKKTIVKTTPVKKTIVKKTPVKKTIVKTTPVKKAIVKTTSAKKVVKPKRSGGGHDASGKYRPYTGVVQPMPKVHMKLTPAKENRPPKKKFDLQASLASKPKWQLKTGKVQKFADTTKIPTAALHH